MSAMAVAKVRWSTSTRLDPHALLKSRLSEAITSADLVYSLISVIACIHAGKAFRQPLAPRLRDELLPVVANVHGRALDALSHRLSPEQIDQGMMTLAAQVILLAEPQERKASRSAEAIQALGYRTILFRNLLENVALAEALTSDLVEYKREAAISRILYSNGQREKFSIRKRGAE